MEPSRTVAQVALPVALPRPLSYSIPPELEGRARPGHRVRVPLRGRTVFGFILDRCPLEDLTEFPPGTDLRAIEALDPEPVLLNPPLLRLAKWVSRYYMAPIGMALEAAVPRSVARPPRGMTTSVLATEATGGAGIRPTAGERPVTCRGSASPIVLNSAQVRAVKRITRAVESREGRTFLLQGVTGSGKTEVYLHAAQAALSRGHGVLLLVPEIALGTQVVRWVRERFGDLVAEYHSQLRPAERRRAWWDARVGRARMVVGARSAVFTPVADLALVVIDEEHEPSYKQGETPRYHGRDTALMRARIEGAVAVLGSATPSLESRTNAEQGKYERLLLPERVDAKPQPEVTLVDLRSTGPAGLEGRSGLRVVAAGDMAPQEPLSEYLLERLRRALAEGDQAILFLNRRGFSTSVQCRDCGYVFECPRCSVVLTHHRSDKRLRCHYCNYTLRDLESCPQCRGTSFSFSGVGTQRVEAALAHHLPQARVLRMDRDSTRKRGVLPAMIEAFERGEADILLGTQMVAKGFDFPRVTVVGVINADREMGLPDFRGQERAFQLLTQVAGRAGRGKKPGEVIFQTCLPDHHVIAAAGQQDFNLFYKQEMEERRPLGYPPHRRMANVLFDGPDEAAVMRRATGEADRLASAPGLVLLGPAPMPLSRLKGQYRWHLTLISSNVKRLTEALAQVVERAQRSRGGDRVRVQVDMDPVSML